MRDRIKIPLADKPWRLALIFLIVILIIVASFFNGLKFAKNNFWQILKPISLISQASFGRVPTFFKNFIHLKQIIKQNRDLIAENLELQSRLAKFSEVEYENEILKKELQFSQSQNQTSQLIPAAIIGRSSGYLKSITIDKGAKDRLQKGQAVISQGFLIGTLTEVRSDNAEVALITDFNSLVPVVLQTSRGTGLLRGGLQGLTVENIPLNIGISKEENVVTSGLGGQIPAGIIIGRVLATVSHQGEIFQKVTVSSPIDLSRLEVVFAVEK